MASSLWHKEGDLNYDIANLGYINRLIAMSKARGITLVFIIPPRAASKELIELLNMIGAKNTLDLSDGEKYPEFYLLENSFDNGHLNSRGSRLFTRQLFDAYKNKI